MGTRDCQKMSWNEVFIGVKYEMILNAEEGVKWNDLAGKKN